MRVGDVAADSSGRNDQPLPFRTRGDSRDGGGLARAGLSDEQADFSAAFVEEAIEGIAGAAANFRPMPQPRSIDPQLVLLERDVDDRLTADQPFDGALFGAKRFVPSADPFEDALVDGVECEVQKIVMAPDFGLFGHSDRLQIANAGLRA
jgi:hypothetical protein